MKSRLLTLSSMALVAAAVAAPAAHAASSTVVLAQAVFRGPVGGNDEFIQLKNVSSGPVDVSGWQIWGSNNTGSAVSARATVPAGITLPAGKSFLFANATADTGYSLKVPPDATYSMGVADNGGIQLRNASGTVIDAVGSNQTVAAYREGAGLPFPTANGTNNAFMRKSSGTQDTDDNVADFAGPQLAAPENCGAACGGQCVAGADGIVPITSIQTLGSGSACDGKTVKVRGIVTGVDDLIGSSFDALYPADRGVWLQSATRDANAMTSSGLFIAGIARNPAGVTADVGKDITITGTIVTQFGLVELVPPGVGSVSSPAAHLVNLADVSTSNGTAPLPEPVVLDRTLSETQDAVKQPYYRGLQGMRVTLPVGIATGGGTSKFRELFLEPGTTAQRLFRKNNQAAIDTPWSDAPAEIGISGEGGAGDPADPRLDWFSSTQVDADLFDIVRGATGPLTYSFSFYEVMPQVGQPQPTIERGAINAAYPGGTAAPDPKPNTLRVASFNVENYFPVGKVNDGHTITQAEYDAKTAHIVKAIRNYLKEPDVIDVQEVATFSDGSSALTGLAAALGNYTPYIATNNDGRGIAPGFLIKDGTTATNGGVMGLNAVGPWTSSSQCDLYTGPGSKLFDRAPYVIDIKKGDLSLTALSNHFASQSHQDACRIAEADFVRQTATTLQQGGRNVLVAGDLNDFEFSQTLATLTQGNVLTNEWSKAPAGQAYSYKFDGHLQTLDHILVTAGLQSRVSDMRYVHFDNDLYERHPTNDGTGESDHDPPVITFDLAQGASVSTPGDVSGNVPATLSLTLGTPIALGTFTPGVAMDYTTSTLATVTSTGADAALSVLDASNIAPGHLVNGTYSLASALQVNADGGAFTPLRADNGPLALTSWSAPVSKRAVTVGFKQPIGASEGLRTGAYAKTLTFTLSTTAP